MKRVYAARGNYEDKIKMARHNISLAGQALTAACKASNIEELEEACDLGGFIAKKAKELGLEEGRLWLIQRLSQDISTWAEDLKIYAGKDAKYPKVRESIISFFKGIGCPMTKTSNDWSDAAFVLVAADVAEFTHLNEICRKLQGAFDDVRWDTPLSGSWTGHTGYVDGIEFHIGIERDKAFDPSGKERSIQLYF